MSRNEDVIERDHYRRIVLEEYPRERAEAVKALTAEKERSAYSFKIFDEACSAAKFTCPVCREPFQGEGPWSCRECNLEGIVIPCPPRVPLAALERDDLRAQLAAVTVEKDKALAAARMLRRALTDLPGDPDEADALAATAWLDESEAKP